MNLVIGSCFRHVSPAQLDRYRRQVIGLQAVADARGDLLHVLSVWGDCTDDTETRLARLFGGWTVGAHTLIERTHGLTEFGSTLHPDRLRGFAYAANGVFEHLPLKTDVVIYVESDLIWDAETLYRLVDHLKPGVDVIAPLTFAGDAMYDLWAIRGLDARHFGPFHPYWDGLRFDGLTEVGSVGSCVVMRGEVARTCRCTPEEALVGFCAQARALGYNIFVDARERVEHPV